MKQGSDSYTSDTYAGFLHSLTEFTNQHKARHWEGKFSAFIEEILPTNPAKFARNSHQYVWDMLRWHKPDQTNETEHVLECRLFEDELFGIDDTLERVADYFKAASAGSEVGRRLLLLLGPPSGGKSTMVILLKRALEEYSHTDDGALYGLTGCPTHENPLHLIPHTLRSNFRETYDVEISGELCPHCRVHLKEEFDGDIMRFPVQRIFISEADRIGVGTYAPHDPATADVADLVGSVDLSKVSEFGDEGDPRAWSWTGAVYSASRGLLEMIEILKVKREFLYLLLTLTQEKNVKVSRFPLIYLDETILAHTNMAEFNKFLQESENEALLDRMVIVKVPYTLSYILEGQIYQKLISSASTFREVHLDPHALKVASVFAILTRLHKSQREGLSDTKKVRLYAGEDVEGFSQTEVEKVRLESPEEGMSGVSPRFVVNAISKAITKSAVQSLTSMDILLALKDSIESDARINAKQKKAWMDYLVMTRKDFYNRWVKEDVHKALFTSFEQEAQGLLEKYLDEVEAGLDNRKVKDPITGEERDPDERFQRAVEEKINISESGKLAFRQEIVRKAMVAFKEGDKFSLDTHASLHDAIEKYLFEERRDVLRLVTSVTRPDDETQRKISAVQSRLVKEYGYDEHSANEALSYVTTLLSQE